MNANSAGGNMLFALVAAIALLFSSPSSSLSSPKSSGVEEPLVCDPDLFLAQKIECYLEAAESRGDPAVCLEVADPVRFQCVTLYAEHSGDTRACTLLAGDDPESLILHNTCLAGVAIARNDPPLCETLEIPGLADACIMQLVLKNDADRGLCERIEIPVLKEACMEE